MLSIDIQDSEIALVFKRFPSPPEYFHHILIYYSLSFPSSHLLTFYGLQDTISCKSFPRLILPQIPNNVRRYEYKVTCALHVTLACKTG